MSTNTSPTAKDIFHHITTPPYLIFILGQISHKIVTPSTFWAETLSSFVLDVVLVIVLQACLTISARPYPPIESLSEFLQKARLKMVQSTIVAAFVVLGATTLSWLLGFGNDFHRSSLPLLLLKNEISFLPISVLCMEMNLYRLKRHFHSHIISSQNPTEPSAKA